MLLCGTMCVIVAWLWSFYLPINKSLWTSSYGLFTAGIALLTLALCIYIVDIRGWQKWTFPFRVYGMNAITVYVLSGVVARVLYLVKLPADGELISLKTWLMNQLLLPWLSPINASLAFALGFVFLSYIAMYFLYKKQIFIKI